MPATYAVRVDWNGDGDFTDTGEDITRRVRASEEVSASYGRETSRSLSPTAPGQASLAVDNRSRDYSPDNAGSPLAGTVGPGRAVQIVGTLSGTDYTLFRGIIDGFEIDPAKTARKLSLSLVDGLHATVGVRVSTPVYAGVTTGQAIHLVLDAIGWPAAARDIDTGATVIPYWWGESSDAWAAIGDLVASEGPPAFVSIDASGNFVFRGRHHRLTRAASLTSQATFRDSGAEPRFAEPFRYDAGWSAVINSVTFSVDVRQPAAGLEVVWSTDTAFAIADTETVYITASSADPFVSAITPVQDVDYVLASGAVTITLFRNSGATTTIAVRAIGGPAVVTGMALRATPLQVARTVQVHAEEAQSIATYGRRSDPSIDAPWAGVWDAIAIGDVILGARAQRLPTVTLTLKGANDTRLLQQLGRDLSDRVTIVEAETATSGDFFVEQIGHSLLWTQRLLTTTFACERAATLPAGVMVLDMGTLGAGTLGSIGIDDPATVLFLDSDVLDAGLLGH
jgi:hypothetical protein